MEATEQMPMFLRDISATISPWILDDTPNVLSVGRRCQEEGWAFYWPPYSANPIFIDPQGRKHILESEGFVPYLRPRMPVIAAAVMQAGGGTSGAATSAVCCAMPAAPAGQASGEESDGEEIDEYDHRGMCERDLREEAVSIAHLMTHFPKNPFCEACRRARLRRKANRRRKERVVDAEVPQVFGSSVTLDHA